MVYLHIDEINKRILNRLKETKEELNYLPKYLSDAEKNKSKNAKKVARNNKKILIKERKDLILLKNKLVNNKNYHADFVYFLLTHWYYNTSRETYFFDKKRIKYPGRIRYFMIHDVAGCCEGVTLTDDLAKEIFFPCKCSKMGGALTVFNSYVNSKKREKINEFDNKELSLMLKELIDCSSLNKKQLIKLIKEILPSWRYYPRRIKPL